MKSDLKIAIVGAGPTGLATACFLVQAGFQPVVFERFSKPQAVGSGLMIQPTGLSCLSDLDLQEEAICRSATVDRIFGDTDNGKKIFDLSYDVLDESAFALGMHRCVLFELLYNKLLSLDVEIETSHRIVDCLHEGEKVWLLREDATELGPFDLIVDASGTGSVLRKMQGDIRRDNLYEFGALWGVCETEPLDQNQSVLIQRYVDAGVMIGLLPLGAAFSTSGHGQTAFFWSLKHHRYDEWRNRPLDDWKEEVASIWPKAAPYVGQFSLHEQLTLATYHDTALRSYTKGVLVFVGDAAHATSPQLGQGANMGLMDARQLARSLAEIDNVEEALSHYEAQRKKQVCFYQMMSHYLTPFFQSDSRLLSKVRDLTFHPMAKVPYLRRQMIQTLASTKTGLFSALKKI